MVETEGSQLPERHLDQPRSSVPSTILPVRPLMLANPTYANDLTVKISDLGVGNAVS